MSANVFLNTNILICALESGGPTPAKTAAAQALVRRTDVCLSTQVLGEFYRAVLLKHPEAVAWVQLWKRHDVRPSTVAHVALALEIAARFRASYFDALILAAAWIAGCAIVFSEDFHAGQAYGGVRVENPLPA